MLLISAEDFFKKAKYCTVLSRKEEIESARNMLSGDLSARGRLVESYLSYVASTLKRLPAKHQTLELIYRCYASLEKAVDRFDFPQDSEPFSHRLNWWMRQTITAYLADRDT